ncbi:hypothetical protein TrST_g7214 [Triparma strigata]|uniref:Uncharacterized protein n=1 Tax=Triparma strigata TaxID=1606541 RepID=A0A9W6ZWG8_9STRA|nr:hypothetical protein TrST_g7214 [Triparma strigata]
MISRNDFLATAATTLLTTVKVSSSSQYDALPKPYEHLSSERIAQIFNNVDAYAVCQKNGVGDYKLYSGILPTRLHAEAVLDAARRDNPGDSFFLADGSFGDCYFKAQEKGIEITPDPKEVKAAKELLKGVKPSELPSGKTALTGAVPLFFDERVRLSSGSSERLLLFFCLADLESMFGSRGGCRPRVTDLQSVATELAAGGPSDYTRVAFRGNVATRNGGFEGIEIDIIDLIDSPEKIPEKIKQQKKDMEGGGGIGGVGDILMLGSRPNQA